ncbi:MAG: cell division protein FtsL [Alphaproteobacteria bacterium]|nr:cell division protein FtsL [Alphaproteobacteria bacterium]MBO7642306.1 cell division protein FtsL [Alphaproteobacteria bacterium]
MVSKRASIFFSFFICVAGTVLFYLKYSVMDIEDRIYRAKKELKIEKANNHILRAEWKALTTPERVQRLAIKHLKMKQILPQQLREYDPSIFHSDSKKQNTKKLSKIISEMVAEASSED